MLEYLIVCMVDKLRITPIQIEIFYIYFLSRLYSVVSYVKVGRQRKVAKQRESTRVEWGKGTSDFI